jgi:hypothetical protein
MGRLVASLSNNRSYQATENDEIIDQNPGGLVAHGQETMNPPKLPAVPANYPSRSTAPWSESASRQVQCAVAILRTQKPSN